MYCSGTVCSVIQQGDYDDDVQLHTAHRGIGVKICAICRNCTADVTEKCISCKVTFVLMNGHAARVVFTARLRMHTHGLAIDILSVRLSVGLSVCEMREL